MKPKKKESRALFSFMKTEKKKGNLTQPVLIV